MILFKEDWEKYPTAFPDVETSNGTFLRYARLLLAMGVVNHSFCLALINKDLKKVDPHSKKLSKSEITAIINEANDNPWYIFREILRLPPSSGIIPPKLEANRGNIAIYWLFFNHITTLLIQPRQTGKSVSTDSLMATVLTILAVNTKIHLLTKSDYLRGVNIKRIKDIMEQFPSYLRMRGKGDVNNTEKITVKKLGNVYATSVPQTSVKEAKKVGRGDTIHINHIDELAYVTNIEHSYSSLLTATTAAREEAEKAGQPYGNVMTTTPGYLNTDDGDYAKTEIYDKAFRWTEKLYDCKNLEDLEETISKNSPSGGLTVLIELNHRQLGKTDAWLKKRLQIANSKGEDGEADYLNKWASGGADSAIDKDTLEAIKASKVNDAYNDVTDYGYIIRWYVPKHQVINGDIKKRRMVLGLDPSEANGGDDISGIFRDIVTGEVLGSLNCNETNTVLFSTWLGELLVEYFNTTLVIEKRSSGSSMVDHLLLILPSKGVDPFRRLFNWVVDESHINPEYYKLLNTPMDKRPSNCYDKLAKQFGFTTTGSGRASREKLYGAAFNASTSYTAQSVRDPILIHQLSRLQKKNGRIDHTSGEHDDSIIAWLLGYWFLSKGRNKHYYNIESRNVLVTVVKQVIKEQGGEEAIREKEHKIKLKEEISSLVDKVKKTDDVFLKMKLLGRMTKLNSQLGKEDAIDLDIDNLIKSAGRDNPKDFIKDNKDRPLRPYLLSA